MPRPRYSIAIETSTRAGELALGRDDALIETVALPPQRRHHVGLMPGIDRVCRAHGLTPPDIGQAYVSLGPGSFTGLRVAVAAAKMLALAAAVELVGVPTLDVLARNAPHDHAYVAPCLNLKGETVYCGVYHRQAHAMTPVVEPALRTLDELLREAPRPVALLGEVLPPLPADSGEAVTVLPAKLARPRAGTVWQLGHELAGAGRYADPMAFEPVYGRRPEAVELWERRRASLPADSSA